MSIIEKSSVVYPLIFLLTLPSFMALLRTHFHYNFLFSAQQMQLFSPVTLRDSCPILRIVSHPSKNKKSYWRQIVKQDLAHFPTLTTNVWSRACCWTGLRYIPQPCLNTLSILNSKNSKLQFFDNFSLKQSLPFFSSWDAHRLNATYKCLGNAYIGYQHLPI